MWKNGMANVLYAWLIKLVNNYVKGHVVVGCKNLKAYEILFMFFLNKFLLGNFKCLKILYDAGLDMYSEDIVSLKQKACSIKWQRLTFLLLLPRNT
jgi:hypothetical protein